MWLERRIEQFELNETRADASITYPTIGGSLANVTYSLQFLRWYTLNLYLLLFRPLTDVDACARHIGDFVVKCFLQN